MTKKLSGWGRFPIHESEVLAPRDRAAVRSAMIGEVGAIARGNGRSYGDAGIGTRQTVYMGACDRIRAFDPSTGEVRVEAGFLLSDLIDTFLPRGYFPPVVPGTKFVTVGGAIAADVHGKNHHIDGGFGDHVDSLVLVTASGDFVTASPSQNAELFFATIGGMGLTGVIVEATLRLRPIETGWIRQETIVASNLDEAITALDDAETARYAAAWIDCVAKGRKLGRSLVFIGDHASLGDLSNGVNRPRFPAVGAPRLSVPFDVPGAALNSWTVGAFNELYFRRGASKAETPSLVPLNSFFFPLDGIGDWNRLYGARGFLQYQCVIPVEAGRTALPELLGRIAERGDASFLAVLKKLGSSSGTLSFPLAGYTLALDFPLRSGTHAFLDELDEIVVKAGGRLYLAKDARQSPAVFAAGYPGLSDFRSTKRQVDPAGRICSHLSERLEV